jgi:hypothetical protein
VAKKKAQKKDAGTSLSDLLADIPMSELAGYEFDPLQLQETGWAGDLPSNAHPGTYGLDFQTMRSMCRFPLVGAIIGRRVQQISEFATCPETPWSIGTLIKMRDPKAKVTRAAEKKMRELEQLVFAMGGRHGNGGYDRWLRMFSRDSWQFDQAVSEKIRTRKGEVVGFKAIDASTIRRAKPSPAALNRGRLKPQDRGFVQMVQQKIVATWKEEEIVWGIRRPRTNMRTYGYGYPELEELINVVTWLLNASTYNGVAFTNGMHASTILLVKSAMEPQKFRAFQRYVRAMLTGPRNALKTPFVRLDPDKDEDIKAVNLSGNPQDLMWKEFMHFWLKVLTGVFLMDPAELGFLYGPEGQKSSLSAQGPGDRIKYSKETGLRPMVRLVETILNEQFVWERDPDFRCVLQGLDVLTQQERLDLDIKKLGNFAKVNEIRSNWDLEEIDSPAADMILNQVYWQAAQQAAMEEQGGEEYGGEGPPEGGESPFGFEFPGDMEATGEEPEGEGPPEGEEGPPAAKAYSLDGHTRWLVEGLEKALRSGRIQTRHGGMPRGPWAPVDAGDGVRAWAVEVDP